MKKILTFVLFTFIATSLFGEVPIVQDIQSHFSKGTKVNIFWVLPKESEPSIEKLVLYRSTTPITNLEQIKMLKPIAELDSFVTGYTDSLKDYNNYYYAVISYAGGSVVDLLMTGINSTVKPVHLEIAKNKVTNQEETDEKLYFSGELREIPLPSLESEESEKSQTILSDKTLLVTKSLTKKSSTENKLLTQYIFEEDLVSPDGGDDFLLFDILKNYFVQKQYKEAITQLERLIGTNINDNTRTRAYFYLGESNYLMGNYKNAIRTFAIVESYYPELTKKWVNSSLDQL